MTFEFWNSQGHEDEPGTNEMIGSSEVSENTLCVDDVDIGLTLQIDYKKPQTAKLTARTPVESYRNFLVPAKDLVLPSCGILSIHESNFSSSLSALLSAHEMILEIDGFPSPITPTVEDVPRDFQRSVGCGDDSSSSPKHSVSPISSATAENYRAFHRHHRHSLPVPSLILTKPTGLNRPITPEIKITEELPSGSKGHRGKIEQVASASSVEGSSRSITGKLNVTIPKRMARSTDDVNRISGGDESPLNVVSKLTSAFGGATPLRFGRIPTNISSDNRAASDVDLFGGMINMKGSHSDNTLQENPYRGQTAPNSKRELVFAPLGKFARGMQSIGANYLDPRKLKGSFKAPIKLESMSFATSPKAEHSKEDITALQERIKACNSLIVEV